MGEVMYKKFTKEEDAIYDKGIETLRKALASGVSYPEACALLDISDAELKTIITDDFLKISIAELHYGGGMPLKEVARRLSVAYGLIVQTRAIMLEDIENTGLSEYHRQTSQGEA
ncbi:MAG: hypothetical protein SFH39_18840 [Candidatus Magnetobacterium sp. LHC-1]|uniref:Uncharacterized protein n=1 Tax=Candidatus Magnetobacterium casense TaxID=1455061 RepID=A0ABS6S2N0_9BACT|nr:hypothetical protein [Candidatus Magnetobacterium casensis]MBF0609133.1 hypothetical protein [Nitrospirota bacterium]MBV6343096.1 hypothetical protein [Candidatus Magnetobacterium casensis]